MRLKVTLVRWFSLALHCGGPHSSRREHKRSQVPAHSSRESIPLANFFQRSNRLTDGWSISGTTRFATGFPVTLTDNSDNSLLGTLGNGKRRVFYGPGIENFDLTLQKECASGRKQVS
jgi:hypothetical protein